MLFRTVAYLGYSVISRVRAFKETVRVITVSVSSLLFRMSTGRKATLRVLLKQVYFTGFEAVPIISWIALILGFIIVTQLLGVLPKLGGERLIGDVLVWVLIREVGPLFSAVIVIARSGTAIASELGTMKISRELSSLEAMGIDPMHYLIMPRVIGTAISVFFLTFYFEAVSILGGYLLAGFGRSISFSVYLMSIAESMSFTEVLVSLLKSAVFGLIIGAVGCVHGLAVEKSITRIPQETTRAVIRSLGLVFVSDAVITFAFFV